MKLNQFKLNSVKMVLTVLLGVLFTPQLQSFCGFYVAKAGSQLFNNKSEVILVRDGNLTTLTMSNDFKGNVKDFAMVVPVPELLRERDIKIVNRNIFDQLDAYSSPRLVEYYDQDPCMTNNYYNRIPMATSKMSLTENASMDMESGAKKDKVKIEAKYSIGEYDIMILSAEESSGLENFLKQNGYAIPDNAREVLQPYINDKLKFFVVKVNLNNQSKSGYNYLRPLQITYSSERFMLPIRLGMANSLGTQDLIVYAMTKKGRVECTNYRTQKMNTGNNIPTFALSNFDSFYSKNFDREYRENNKNTVFLEYAWDVSPSFLGMKCDPCVGNPPMMDELRESGVNWLSMNSNESVFFTRLHVRYSRDKFPQDLMFQVTPNKEQFQARYVITHPSNNTNCEKGKEYLEKVEKRKVDEVLEYCKLTGDNPMKYLWYANLLKTSKIEPVIEPIIEKPESNLIQKIIDTFKFTQPFDKQPSEVINDSTTNEQINPIINKPLKKKKGASLLNWLLVPLGLMGISIISKYFSKTGIIDNIP